MVATGSLQYITIKYMTEIAEITYIPVIRKNTTDIVDVTDSPISRPCRYQGQHGHHSCIVVVTQYIRTSIYIYEYIYTYTGTWICICNLLTGEA
jgi:hypothetical protein